MKFEVHWAPSVKVMLPGLIVAELAGAHAPAAVGASAATASTSPAIKPSFLRRFIRSFLRLFPPGPHARNRSASFTRSRAESYMTTALAAPLSAVLGVAD